MSGLLDRLVCISLRAYSPPPKRLAYLASLLVHVLVMSGLIMDDANLREVRMRSFNMMLPSSLAAPFVRAVSDAAAVPLPSKSTISRWRVMLDVAYMLWTRDRFQQEHVHFGMVDSSTQGGKDYELCVVSSVLKADLPALVDRADKLLSIVRARSDVEESWRDMDAERELMQCISERIKLHRPPPVMLASGRTRLFDKFVAMCHAFMLETHGPQALREFHFMPACAHDRSRGRVQSDIRAASRSLLLVSLCTLRARCRCEAGLLL